MRYIIHSSKTENKNDIHCELPIIKTENISTKVVKKENLLDIEEVD
jgi:hypothetical protein